MVPGPALSRRNTIEMQLIPGYPENDADHWYHSPAERALRLQRSASRNVDLHGWAVTPTEDGYGLAVTHGD